MNTERFFQQIWRANALIIFAAGLLSVGVLVFALYNIAKDVFRVREVRAVVNTDNTEAINESLSLGVAGKIVGHPWLLVPLESDQQYDQAYYSKSASAIRNYAFLGKDGRPHWLYPHNKFLIADADQLPPNSYENKEEPTQAILFLVRKEDTNGDQRLTGLDSGVVVFTSADGTGAKEVLSDVWRIMSQNVRDEEVLILYEGKGGPFSATVSLKDFSLVRHERIVFPGGGA